MTTNERSENTVMRAVDQRLKKRALRLAQPLHNASEQTTQWLSFRLQDKTYALDSRWLISAGSYKKMTPLHLFDAVVLGVVNWRGTMLGVIDLCPWLYQPQEIDSYTKEIIVVGDQQAQWCVAVNQVVDLMAINNVEIEQCRLNDQDNDDEGLMLGRLKSGTWLLNGHILLSRMNKLIGKEE